MKRFLHEALPPEQQLLILKGCCCTRPSGCAVKSSGAAAELRFLSHPIRPSDVIHSQMLSHHFSPIAAVCESLYLFAGSLLHCPVQKWLCQKPPGSCDATPSSKGCSGAGFALPPISSAVCEAGRWHLGKAAGLTAWETEGFYFSPSRQSTDTLPHAVLHPH